MPFISRKRLRELESAEKLCDDLFRINREFRENGNDLIAENARLRAELEEMKGFVIMKTAISTITKELLPDESTLIAGSMVQKGLSEPATLRTHGTNH